MYVDELKHCVAFCPLIRDIYISIVEHSWEVFDGTKQFKILMQKVIIKGKFQSVYVLPNLFYLRSVILGYYIFGSFSYFALYLISDFVCIILGEQPTSKILISFPSFLKIYFILVISSFCDGHCLYKVMDLLDSLTHQSILRVCNYTTPVIDTQTCKETRCEWNIKIKTESWYLSKKMKIWDDSLD